MSGQDYRVPPQNRESIRSIVRSLRGTFGITGLKFPVMEVIEFALPQLIPDFELHIGGMKEMGDTHGLTYPQEHLLILREDIYEGALNGVGRDRMTAAHELGHLLMHKNIAFARSAPGLKIRPFESSEWQAKCFSGELLVPAIHSRVLKGMSAEKVAEICGVSLEAARYQLGKM
ncbi:MULTISPECIES: ImmA/IrrE family metallo-endopeptidase [Kosakonia]|uniref:ImmA/IrrE family metallo-endopeptidase n=1 Tax=Kosakonia TaxID=1330547 RepID=UPI0005F0B807|nr:MULTISPECIES: ImmA/IrrE family metallo-endopeptidase [Kosakonia]RCX00585.1 Zn-dependent peptidase ImmA (M78 family) [Kosakonia sp. AG348]